MDSHSVGERQRVWGGGPLMAFCMGQQDRKAKQITEDSDLIKPERK